jgi:hypothetical protein
MDRACNDLKPVAVAVEKLSNQDRATLAAMLLESGEN